MVLLGWDLDRRVVEACAEECTRHGCDLYLWQPVLTSHRSFRGDPHWSVVSLSGLPVEGPDGKPEFTFVCPNRPEAHEGILRALEAALAGGHYQGIFLDRIRFPSPGTDFAGQFGCFCDACRAAARSEELDLNAVREGLGRLLSTGDGRRAAISAMLSRWPMQETDGDVALLNRMLGFRQRSIAGLVGEIADAARGRGLKVGLDCFAPTLARMVGQDLSMLAKCSDWIKLMTYARAFAPASLPYEIVGITSWLMSIEGGTEATALDCLAAAAQWPLPGSREAIRTGGLPSTLLTMELHRGREAGANRLLAGMELVEIPGVSQLESEQIGVDAEAVLAGRPDGVVFSWDLWRIPANRLKLAGSLYGKRENPR
jgi:hypothetical protein